MLPGKDTELRWTRPCCCPVLCTRHCADWRLTCAGPGCLLYCPKRRYSKSNFSSSFAHLVFLQYAVLWPKEDDAPLGSFPRPFEWQIRCLPHIMASLRVFGGIAAHNPSIHWLYVELFSVSSSCSPVNAGEMAFFPFTLYERKSHPLLYCPSIRLDHLRRRQRWKMQE